MTRSSRLTGLFALFSLITGAADKDQWIAYGHDPGGQRYSPLTQITPSNIKDLKPAWTFHTSDAYKPKRGRATAFEATPLYVDGLLFLSTPLGRAIALDPVHGKQVWTFDAHIDKDAGYGDYASRGVSTWKDKAGQRRIYMTTIDAKLFAIDAKTGKLCDSFGNQGVIDLRTGLRNPVRDYSSYEETSPPAIVGDRIVVGSGVADNQAVQAPSGEIRAFDAQSGKLLWTWDPIPQQGEAGWEPEQARKTGAANAWSVISVDTKRNLIFLPTSSASPDYFGGERLGDNLYANSVVALDAKTGKRVWHFQTVHHDLWDYDMAAPPILFSRQDHGKKQDVVAAASKTGQLFILDRQTGKPVFPVEERTVAKSDVDGESSSPTQPFATKPSGLMPEHLAAKDAWGADESDRAWCEGKISKLRHDGIFTPPSIKGSLMIPGNIGGMAWGGFTFDPVHQLLIFPVNNLPAEVRLIPRDRFKSERESNERNIGGDWEFAPQHGTPFGMARHILLTPKHHLPCIAPPWGQMVAVDVNHGDVRWRSTAGQLPWLASLPGSEKWGSPMLGGPISTAGGLVFQAGTFDGAIYAFESRTGKPVWKHRLSTSARSTPMTYLGPNGKQYVVIAAGGHGIDEAGKLDDSLMAFALP